MTLPTTPLEDTYRRVVIATHVGRDFPHRRIRLTPTLPTAVFVFVQPWEPGLYGTDRREP